MNKQIVRFDGEQYSTALPGFGKMTYTSLEEMRGFLNRNRVTNVEYLNKIENIKTWYKSEFTTDELGEEINPTATFEELKNNLPNVYDYLDVTDSIVRERVFYELAKRMSVDYGVIYTKWLNG